jgi:hypothetical protein
MREAHDQMHRIIVHFVSRFFRLEVKRAETAVAASGGVQFLIEIKDALAPQINYARRNNRNAAAFPRS